MKKPVLVLCAVHAIALIAAIALLQRDIVPIHWGINGQADRHGSKWVMLLFAFIPFLLQWLKSWYYASGRATENMKKNRKQEEGTITATTLLLIAVSWGVYALIASDMENIGMVFPGILIMLIGALLMYISNTMGTVRQNRYYGIKMPWTLKDETVWKKTHRLGAYTGMAGGFLTLLGGALGLAFNLPVFALCGVFLGITGVGVIPSVYAWRLYRKLHPRGESDEE